ncbi:MAG: sensor domain-containing protein [Bifidobacteriaceae bacterium]|jgi:signal transduction histidine kinase|nr:sensor domain-containing protein [Bifidobacteriaceae bacterium]
MTTTPDAASPAFVTQPVPDSADQPAVQPAAYQPAAEPVADQGFRALLTGAARDSLYLLVGFPIALAGFILVLVGICVGLPLIIIWVGLPITWVALLLAHWFANLERVRLRARGTDIAPLPSAKARSSGLFNRFFKNLANPGRWREALHTLVNFPLAVFTWSIALAWWCVAAGGLTTPIWYPLETHLVPNYDEENTSLPELLNWPIPEWAFYIGLGALGAITLPWVMKAMAALHAGLARALLSPSPSAMARRVEELTQARDHATAAESQSLRRLERDLHDGPQQALIRLGMDLSAAQRRLDEGDPAAASEIVGQARHLTDTVISDLRALSRGIAPPILRERGLGAALTAAVAASPLPATLQLEGQADLPEPVATAAYFVVTEALANAAKHSGAKQVHVYARAGAAGLDVEVSDDGHGGAAVLPGHGLAGLQDRVAALEGTLNLDSVEPIGTKLSVHLPL